MDCPVCGTSTYVIDSRPQCDHVKRRRACLDCGFRFSTIEIDVDMYKRMQLMNKIAIYKKKTEAAENLQRAALCASELDERMLGHVED